MLGSPIGHSLSPVLHRAAYAALGLDWSYEAHDVGDEAALRAFLGGVDATWVGLSLTMPLKQAVIPFCTEVTPVATSVQAVNTILFRDGRHGAPQEVSQAVPRDRRRVGDNTDVPGMVAALHEHRTYHVRQATVLGGGATARSAVAALAGMADRVEVVVRNPARSADLLELGRRLGIHVDVRPWADPVPAAPLVINTTPAHAADALASAVPPDPGVLFDVVYNPWPTTLAHAWARCGGSVVSGLDLLVHQAALQVELMTGHSLPPLAAMRVAGEQALAARR